MSPQLVEVDPSPLRERSPNVLLSVGGRAFMPEDDGECIHLSERDIRSLAMQLALQLPRNEEDARRIMDLMRLGYDLFLCEFERPPEQEATVVRPKFSRRPASG